MICPRCSVAEISPETNRCDLCGYSGAGTRAVAVQAPMADEVHETVQRELADRFQLQVLVHRDQGSTLYLARDLEDDRLVSLRLIPRKGPVEPPVVQRYTQACTLATQFRHPHLVPVRKHGMTNSLLWYSMDAVKSRSLGMVLERAGQLPLARTLELLEQVASALEYLHRNAAVHGGVGRDTVLVDGEGWVRVSDPGTAAALYRAAGPGVGWETLLDLPFAAPELLERRPMGPAADQYALAVMAYACLAGRLPFEGTTADELRQQRAAPPVSLDEYRRDLPPYVDTAIRRALRAEPSERFGSVLDVVAVLGGASVRASGALLIPSTRPTGAPVVVVPPAPQVVRRRRLGVGVVVLLLVTAAIVVGVRQLSRDGATGEWAEGPAPAPAVTPAPADQDAVADSAAATSPVVQPPAPQPEAAAPTPVPRRRVARGAGTLFVNASPWGSLYVDGRLVGNTPQVNLRLTAGVYTLRIVRDGFTPWEQEVTVQAGDTLRLTDIVLQPLQP